MTCTVSDPDTSAYTIAMASERIARLDALRRIAAAQDGQFATQQALSCGLNGAALRALAGRGEITQVRRGVWRFCAASGTPDPAISAYLACWPHAVISHESAARFHDLTRIPTPAVPVITLSGDVRCRRPGITVHRTVDLPGQDVVHAAGVRYTSLARTVCDLADAEDPWETLALVDDAVAAGANPRWIHQRATALRVGRSGVGLVTRATDPDAANAFRSYLERVSAHIYRVAGLPDPEWNVPVHDARGLIGVVDALWDRWMVISEKEGLRFHTSPLRRREDARRFNRLCDAGYAPRRFTWEDVVHRPVEVAATIMRALRGAGADLDPARIPRAITIPDAPFG